MGIRELIADCFVSDMDVFAAQAPQNSELPYNVYSVVVEEKLNALDSQCDFERIRFDLNTYAATYAESVTLSRILQRKLLDYKGFACVVFSVSETVEEGGTIYRTRVDFTLAL